ncbi:DUF21 domain-containing protein At4g14240-like [Humulus lupulus]|uniref:DUF21 domain-containing protein At4g14240-like n=1 Tax=Humulus lupulus TaxID=3486 RepID=UPI002B40F9AA|nr:DUF21 domain-containing protein At4g14240-like [Humulus lupulus]
MVGGAFGARVFDCGGGRLQRRWWWQASMKGTRRMGGDDDAVLLGRDEDAVGWTCALPIYLDKMFNQYVAIILSMTFVLFFGEVIPQAICTRYGLAVGSNFVWLVRILMIICYPISYPIGKILDWVLGHNKALFRRAQLKAGKGGELTNDETTIISGALDLTKKSSYLLV